MIKVNEDKLVEVIKNVIKTYQDDFFWDLDVNIKDCLYEIIQENTLDMDDDDIHKLFLAVESYLNKGK